MTMSQVNAKPRSKQYKTLVSLLVGGLAGGIASAAALGVIASGRLGELGLSREIAILVGVLYLVCAAGVGFGALSPRAGSRFLNVEDAEELREQRGKLLGGAVATGAIGLALMLAAIAAPVGPLAASVALACVVALIGLAGFLGVRQQKQTDEFMRELSRDALAAAFYLISLAGGGWSLLAHLGFVPGPEPIDWLTMFVGVLILATLAACMQRGLMTPR